MPKTRLLARGALTMVALAAFVSVTGATARVRSSDTSKVFVLKLAGFRNSVWVVVRAGSQVTLWSHTLRGPWKRLKWPAGAIPMQLTRESSSTAWMVTTSNHLYVSTDGGHAWKLVPLPALLTYHPKWAQGLKVSSSHPHTLTLLAWGPEAAFQSAKILWSSPNYGQTWTRVTHSAVGLIRVTASWWPKTPKTGLPTTGDPVTLHMLGVRTGYLMATTAGGPFLWRTTNGGAAWTPMQVLGMPKQQEDQGITVLAAEWSDGTGWVTLSSTEGPGLIRLTGQSARMVALPPRLVDGISASLVSAASGSVIGKVHPHWSVFTTIDGGADWQSLSLAGSILPLDGLITQTYRTPQALWIVLSGRLYAGTTTSTKTWHKVALP